MRRWTCEPRVRWQEHVERLGFASHSYLQTDNKTRVPYWNESAYYELSIVDAEFLQRAAQDAYRMMLETVERVIEGDGYDALGVPLQNVPAIIRSWERDDPTFICRFDLSYDGKSFPKLLGIAPVDTALLIEAALVQWKWKEEIFPGASQSNTIYEDLLGCFRTYGYAGSHLHFTSESTAYRTEQIEWFRCVAREAGVSTTRIGVGDIRWDESTRRFIDADGRPIVEIVTGYPPGAMLADPFGAHLREDPLIVHEPLWKVLVSAPGFEQLYRKQHSANAGIGEGPQRPELRVSVWVIGGTSSGIVLTEQRSGRPQCIPHILT